MALKEYDYAGGTYQFEEGKAPKGATPTKRKSRPAPANKQAPPSADKSVPPEGDKTPPEGEQSSADETTEPAKGAGKGKASGKEGSKDAGDPSAAKS